MKIVIVGGVAAGASAAARARRMDDSAEIVVFEKGPYVSFANCGLPYYVGGDIPQRDNLLLVSPERFKTRFHIDVRPLHEVTSIDRENKTVSVTGPEGSFTESYDKLILAPGCRPLIPKIKGAELKNISTVFTIDDVDRIMSALDGGVKAALVVGGGFIGLETAEALLKRGLDVTLVEMADHLMTIFDREFSLPMEKHLSAAGLKILLGKSVSELLGNGKVSWAVLSDGTVLPAQLVIMSAGLRPCTELAQSAGLAIGSTGGIAVDNVMRTSDPDIYAAGDAVESTHIVSGKPIRVSLANNANRQGRIAGDNAVGRNALRYKGTLATSVIRVADLTAARTGLSEREARALGFDCRSVYAPEPSNASYFPGFGWLILKLTFENETGRILGAQAVGERGVEKRIDVLATAIYAGLSVFDLENLDLCYAPPYSSAKGPEIMAGMTASNVVRGDVRTVTCEQRPELLSSGAQLIDLREQSELDEEGGISGARLIPLDTLRADPSLLERGKKYVFYCGVGKRAYNACRFMAQLGYDVYNLTGGYNAYIMDV